MLPMLAMLLAGYMAKQRGAGAEAQPPSAGGGLGGLLAACWAAGRPVPAARRQAPPRRGSRRCSI